MARVPSRLLFVASSPASFPDNFLAIRPDRAPRRIMRTRRKGLIEGSAPQPRETQHHKWCRYDTCGAKMMYKSLPARRSAAFQRRCPHKLWRELTRDKCRVGGSGSAMPSTGFRWYSSSVRTRRSSFSSSSSLSRCVQKSVVEIRGTLSMPAAQIMTSAARVGLDLA